MIGIVETLHKCANINANFTLGLPFKLSITHYDWASSPAYNSCRSIRHSM